MSTTIVSFGHILTYNDLDLGIGIRHLYRMHKRRKIQTSEGEYDYLSVNMSKRSLIRTSGLIDVFVQLVFVGIRKYCPIFH